MLKLPLPKPRKKQKIHLLICVLTCPSQLHKCLLNYDSGPLYKCGPVHQKVALSVLVDGGIQKDFFFEDQNYREKNILLKILRPQS